MDAASLTAVIEALDSAPLARRLTAEQRAELDADMADIAAGRLHLILEDEIPVALEAMDEEHGGCVARG